MNLSPRGPATLAFADGKSVSVDVASRLAWLPDAAV
jgi:hypothetical protein